MDPRCPGGVGEEFEGTHTADPDFEIFTELEHQRQDLEKILKNCWVFGKLPEERFRGILEKFEHVELFLEGEKDLESGRKTPIQLLKEGEGSTFMRDYMYDFLGRFAPHLTRELVEASIACNSRVELDELFKEIFDIN